MDKLVEIRWHGRGGQGAVTAAKFLAEVALSENQFFQAFPEYGPERMGAPIQAFTRVSGEPIYLRCGVESPNYVVVLDPTLLSAVDVLHGIKDNGELVVNTPESPEEIRRKLEIKPGIGVHTVDATRISLETLGKPIPNTPMIGALIKVTGLFPLDRVLEVLRKSFGKKFSGEVIEKNLEAVRRAYSEVRSG